MSEEVFDLEEDEESELSLTNRQRETLLIRPYMDDTDPSSSVTNRSPLDDLRSFTTGDPLSPIIAFNLETLSRLRDSGVSAATALALLQEAVRIGKTSVISVILETYKDQVSLPLERAEFCRRRH